MRRRLVRVVQMLSESTADFDPKCAQVTGLVSRSLDMYGRSTDPWSSGSWPHLGWAVKLFRILETVPFRSAALRWLQTCHGRTLRKLSDGNALKLSLRPPLLMATTRLWRLSRQSMPSNRNFRAEKLLPLPILRY